MHFLLDLELITLVDHLCALSSCLLLHAVYSPKPEANAITAGADIWLIAFDSMLCLLVPSQLALLAGISAACFVCWYQGSMLSLLVPTQYALFANNNAAVDVLREAVSQPTQHSIVQDSSTHSTTHMGSVECIEWVTFNAQAHLALIIALSQLGQAGLLLLSPVSVVC